MRYFLVLIMFICVVTACLFGFRGGFSRRPPMEIFSDMKRQPRLQPQSINAFFTNGISSQPIVQGTIARNQPFEDSVINTGRIPGSTNFVELIPIALNSELLARGKERYQIFCSPCHSPMGDGIGITTKYNMLRAANYHDPRIIRMADGEIFNTIIHGKNLMAAYGAHVEVNDRWAVIAYIRALQLTQLGTAEDVPEQNRGALK